MPTITSKKARLTYQICKYIEEEGKRQHRDVFTEGIFLRDPSNSHDILYPWDGLIDLQIDAIWNTIRNQEHALELSFVVYKEKNGFKAACGLKVVNSEWLNYLGFKEENGKIELIPIYQEQPRARREQSFL